MSVLVSHRGVAAQLSFHLQNDGQTAVVKVNGEDYPVAIDMEDGKLKVRVWQRAGTDLPSDTIETQGYINFPLERAIEKAQCLAVAGKKTKFVVEMDQEPEGRFITVVDEDYLACDEYEAFNGTILASAEPDGGVERTSPYVT